MTDEPTGSGARPRCGVRSSGGTASTRARARAVKRWATGLVGVVSAVAGIGLFPATAAADDAAAEQQLAERYAPVVRLVDQGAECGPGEAFIPTDVDAILPDDGVALRGPWDTDDLVKIAPSGRDLTGGLPDYHLDLPGDPLNPGCTYEQWAGQVTQGTRPTTYAHVVREEGRQGLALQYWFFYPFNDFNNKHESDWEMVQVEFAGSDAATALQQGPTRVGYSQHEGVELAPWGDDRLELVDGVRPVVHVAAGSHANYYDDALFLGRSGQQGFGCDDTRGPAHDVDPVVALVPSEPTAMAADYPWLAYEGRWGQRESSFYNGPTGPNTKDQWSKPLTWTDTEGADTSYAVPASGLFGTTATSTFCGTVASGSNLLRLALARPGLAALVVLGSLLVLAWLARRTTWRPSAPLRLARRRTMGQLIAAVWRMYLGNLGLFTRIGAPIAVATVLPGIAELWVRNTAEALAGGAPGARSVLVVVGALVLAALAPATLLLAGAAVVTAVTDLDAGRPTSARRAYREGLRRGVPLFLTVGTVAVVALATVLVLPLSVLWVVANLLLVPVIVVEGRSGWGAVRRSAHLVRRHWVKALVLVLLTSAVVYAIGPILGTVLILGTSMPFAVSNAVAGIVYALLVPIVGLNTLYVYADAAVRDVLDPPRDAAEQLPAEAELEAAAMAGRSPRLPVRDNGNPSDPFVEEHP